MKFILGTKKNMLEFFAEDGKVVPVTEVSVGPAVVTQIRTKSKDGYDAVQIGFGKKSAKNLGKALAGHLKDLGNFRYIREFRLTEESALKVGDTLSAGELFKAGDKVRVSGVSKGKGFQGVIKRHDFGGGPRSHGQKHSEREPGSIGGGLRTHVPKGMRMAGRMGGDRITQKNMEIVLIDADTNTMLVKGAVPGSRGSLVEIAQI
jgi:large subunit ribosomal protein L3